MNPGSPALLVSWCAETAGKPSGTARDQPTCCLAACAASHSLGVTPSRNSLYLHSSKPGCIVNCRSTSLQLAELCDCIVCHMQCNLSRLLGHVTLEYSNPMSHWLLRWLLATGSDILVAARGEQRCCILLSAPGCTKPRCIHTKCMTHTHICTHSQLPLHSVPQTLFLPLSL